jgi:hypothetical protein
MEIEMPRKKVIVPPFATTDLYFAAFLQARGVKLLRTTREGSRVTFAFDGVEAPVLRDEWFAMSGMVNGPGYANAIRNLKQLVGNRL